MVVSHGISPFEEFDFRIQHLTRKIYLEKVRVYFSGENLFELINNTNGAFDPEINTGDGSMSNGVFGRTDPMYRTISFGIQLTL